MYDKENITHYYLNLYDEFVQKYGENTIILMEVGSFYEMYGIETDKIIKGKVTEIANLLNIQCTKKDKAKLEEDYSNPRMAGFPSVSLSKYLNIILENNYTVVLVEQTTPPPKPIRKVTKILSPGTNFDTNKVISSNLMSIYIEKLNEQKLCIGISLIDVITGRNKVFETYSHPGDKDYGLEEIFRMIKVYNPTEILINSKEFNMSNKEILSYFEIENLPVHINSDIDVSSIETLSFQKQYFEKIFKPDTMITVIEYLDLEKKIWGTISYIYLLQFAYEHDVRILDKLTPPSIINQDNLLLLANNTVQQLNITSNTSTNTINNSLLGLINKCSTAMGKRLFVERLLNPIRDNQQLNRRYDLIDSMLDNENYQLFEKMLKNMNDLERYNRRMSIAILHPCELANMIISYTYASEILNNYKDIAKHINQTTIDINHENKFLKFIGEYNEIFNDEMYKYNIDKIASNIFNEGVYPELDKINEELKECEKFFIEIKDIFSSVINSSQSTYKNTQSDPVKIDFNERDGTYLSITKKRYEILKNHYSEKPYYMINSEKFNFNDIEVRHDKGGTKLYSHLIKKNSDKVIILKDKLNRLSTKFYIEKLHYFSNKYDSDLKYITNIISEIDVLKSCAKTSIIYNYKRPVIDEDADISSYIDAQEVRHPIIERIQTDIEYVPNNINLGNNSQNGMLLYSVNAAGKSSLMKSIGINIIMAQAGMFVAASSFTYKPYKNIFTRISGNDNLFKGQSSFAVEMSELRGILKRADNSSLILGDELCSGTETESAQAIVAAGIIWLSSKNASFIFATHLHQLSKMDQINELDNVNHYHLKVEYEPISKKLTYNRKLSPGSGISIYGLEVCKAMDLDHEFLELANTIRLDLSSDDNEILTDKKSKYNANIIIDKCEICNSSAEDVHHIKFQCTADKNNMIGIYHKNIDNNLVCLCKQCHIDVHNDKIEIYGYQKTSSGNELKFKIIKSEELDKDKNKKYSPEQIAVILEIKKQNKKISQKDAVNRLREKNSIKISPATLSKIWNGKY